MGEGLARPMLFARKVLAPGPQPKHHENFEIYSISAPVEVLSDPRGGTGEKGWP
jgi:hypothetical protein